MNKVLPKYWSIKTLSELAHVDQLSLNGNTPSDYKFKYIDIASVKTGQIDIPSETILFGDAPSRARKCVRKGDILMSTVRPNLQGFVYFSIEGGEFIASTGFAVITANKNSDGKFLYQTLFSDKTQNQINALVTGSNYPAISSTNVKQLEVLTPPLLEQKKIGSILSSVDDVIEKNRAQIAKLKDLKTGMMQELLTKGIGHTEFKSSPVGEIPVSWTISPIGALLEFKNGLNKEKDYFGRGNPIVNFIDVFHGYGIKLTDLSGKVELTPLEQERFAVKKGDVFFTRTSETPNEIGMAAVFLDNALNVSFSGFVLRGRPISNKLEILFCKYCFSADYIRKQIISSCSYTTRALTNGTLLSQCLIAIPPKKEQLQISIIIDALVAKLNKSQQKLNGLQNLKKALMQDLLTGKVRVNIEKETLKNVQ